MMSDRFGSLATAGLVLAATLWVTDARAQVNCNPGVEFYADGSFKSCILNGNHQLYTARGDVLTCADGYRLEQYPDGRLKSCTIREPARVVIGEAPCSGPARVELSEEGELRECRQL